MSDLTRFHPRPSKHGLEMAEQENGDYAEYRQAADLIDQLQLEVECQMELRKYAVNQLDNERKTTAKLAAHVERLREGLNDAIEALVSETMESGVVEENEIHDLRTLEMSVPQTSLAEVRAKAVEAFAQHCFSKENTEAYMWDLSDVKDEAKDYAAKIRNGKDGE